MNTIKKNLKIALVLWAVFTKQLGFAQTNFVAPADKNTTQFLTNKPTTWEGKNLAPFAFKDLQGNLVSNETLKGKYVLSMSRVNGQKRWFFWQ
jgi:hypothetical protein